MFSTLNFGNLSLGAYTSTKGVGGSLSRWLARLAAGTTGNVLRLEGDSTWASFTTLNTEHAAFTTKPGELLAGVTITNAGNNGATLASYLDDTAPNSIADTIAAAPNLIALRYGINDVRNGGCSQATLTSRLITAVDTLRAALPNADIALVVPNSLLSTDPGATGYVTSAGIFTGMTLAQAAQAATDIMWGAYMSLRRRWPNVIVIDTQTDIYGRTCPATSAMMLDILHPVNTSAHAITMAAYFAGFWGYRPAFDAALSAAAWAGAGGNPLTAAATYARALEDPNFMTLVSSGRWAAQGAGSYLDFGPSTPANTHTLDYVQQAYSLGNFQIPSGAVIVANGANTRIYSLSGGQPPYAQTGGTIRVYRKV